MNSTGCISLAGSLVKTRGTPGFFGQLVRQPFLQLNREYHDPCEPRHLSWQWRVKDSPDVQRCSKLCLKKKACPKKRFFPRFKKSFIYHDIFACDPPKEKQTWGEYLSFLLPDDMTSKPQMSTCRKMLEHRRRKCMDVDNYTKCVQGECWPLPTEWYGQGVLHISELALTRPPYKPVESVKPCPPPANMITKCVVKKLPVCPGNELFCLEDTSRKMPYSQFKGADTDGGPPSITLRCPIKYVPEMMPDKHQDRHYKLSCKTYGDFKNVECPPQMFNRYMDVDFSSKNLLPIPTTMPGYTPQREVKKGVCGRQTLLRPPSARNFSTGQAFMAKDYPEFIKVVNTNHLQPAKSPICFDKLVDRAGMNAELLNKPFAERPYENTQRMRSFTEKELEKHELEAQLSEETSVEKKRRLESKKSKLQMLIEKQNKETEKKQGGPIRSSRWVTSWAISRFHPSDPV
uniref:Uncharacterized protein n=1 Tax=Lygus hesperus TaxID=30085 RepID=A0A0A9YAZ1_LYGHE